MRPAAADQPRLLTNVDPMTAGQTNTYVVYDDDATNNVQGFGGAWHAASGLRDRQRFRVTFGGGINQGHRIAVDPRTGAIYSL